MQEPILIYAKTLTARLDYICKFIFRDLLQVPFAFTTSVAKLESYESFFINYSSENFENGLQIIPHTLMFELDIAAQIVDENEWNNVPIFFKTEGKFIPFDIFSASFYLISRYEEYIETKTDEYDRFPHTSSLAYNRNFLHLPLVDIWCHKMYDLICEKEISFQKSPKCFTVLHTFDIDMISAYRYKGVLKNIGGIWKDMLQKKWPDCLQRLQVLFGKQKDIFDSFSEIKKQFSNNDAVIFFFLMAKNQSKFDKNLSVSHSAMNLLIQDISAKYDVAIHPSYLSNQDASLVLKEIQSLQKIANKTISESRQHYIKFNLPKTYQQLINIHIEIDYSMGYGSINGFRASTCTPFCWFDVSTNKSTALQIVPFCWMDANCMYEQKMNACDAIDNWLQYYQICKAYNGLFVDIWHNFIIGNGVYNKDWMDAWRKSVTIES